jgi:hypothetical protein
MNATSRGRPASQTRRRATAMQPITPAALDSATPMSTGHLATG